MLDAVRPLILRVLKVPAEPAAPAGPVRVFRASDGYYRYRLLHWALAQAGALAGIVAGLAFVRSLPGEVPGTAMSWLRFGEMVAAAGFLLQLPFSFAMLRLDFELRWYIVGERSLRIREGLARVREQTMTFANIQNVSIRQGPLQRWFGISDLEVRTAGGGAGETHGSGAGTAANSMHVGTFRGVEDAASIRDTIREQVRRFRDAGLGDPDDAAAPEHPEIAPPSAAPAVLAAREVLDEARALRAALRG